MRTTLIASILFVFFTACGGEATPQPTTPTTPTAPGAPGVPGAEPKTFAEQAAAGEKLYADSCASCHGAAGEGGGKSPRVVGLDKGALPLDPPATAKSRKVQFKTAADVGEWVAKNMPPGQAGSLKESEYWSIMAFDLKANGVSLDKKLDATTAKEVVLRK